MVKLEYLGDSIDVPESWADIKLKNYEAFYKSKPESVRDKITLISNICEMPLDVLLNWPAEVFNIIIDKTLFIFKPYEVEPSSEIIINGVKYSIPIEEKLSLGAYIDAEESIKNGERPFSEVLAITCRPAGEKYDPDKTEKRASMFSALSVEEVQPLLSFFLRCSQELGTFTRAYTNLAKAINQLPPPTLSFLRRGGGIKLLRTFREIKYGVLMMLLVYRLRRFSRLYNIKETKRTRKMSKGNLIKD